MSKAKGINFFRTEGYHYEILVVIQLFDQNLVARFKICAFSVSARTQRKYINSK